MHAAAGPFRRMERLHREIGNGRGLHWVAASDLCSSSGTFPEKPGFPHNWFILWPFRALPRGCVLCEGVLWEAALFVHV